MDTVPHDALHEEAIPPELLTGPGGRFEVEGDLRARLAFTSDNVLFVAQGQLGDHHVLTFQNRLRLNNIRYATQERPYTEIAAMYAEGAARVRPVVTSASDLQKEALQLLRLARQQDVQDMHITTGRFPKEGNLASETSGEWIENTVVQFRRYGDLEIVHQIPRAVGEQLIATVYQSMCEVPDKAYHPHLNQNAKLRNRFAEAAGLHAARIATGPKDNGTHCVIRLHPNKGSKLYDMRASGYAPAQASAAEEMLRHTNGLHVVSGPVNSGKTTLLAGLVRRYYLMHRGRRSVISAEDPVEIPMPGVEQKPVLDGDWLGAIEHALRSDANLFVFGEVRSKEAICNVVTASITGRPTWTTVHTNDAVTILDRFRDAGVAPSLLTDPTVFSGLINQNMTQRLCSECKVRYLSARDSLSANERTRIEAHCDPEKVFLRNIRGCPDCHRGIAGRVIAAEVIVPTADFLETYLREGKLSAWKYWKKEMGGFSKCDHLVRHIEDGLVDPRIGELDICALDNDIKVMGGRRAC